jgi:hypothetical protein
MITMNPALGKRNSFGYTALAVLAVGLMPGACKKTADQTAAQQSAKPSNQTVPADNSLTSAPAGTQPVPAAPAPMPVPECSRTVRA